MTLMNGGIAMRKYRAIVSACLATVIFISVGTSFAATLDKIRFPYSPIAWNSLLWFVAKDAKLFEKHGLDVDIFFEGASPLIVQAMLAGEVQFGGVGGPTVITNVLKGRCHPGGGGNPDLHHPALRAAVDHGNRAT
jgi:ABC-type nitrate/sulfonate/bicarbonate transport system substrate-binding protein